MMIRDRSSTFDSTSLLLCNGLACIVDLLVDAEVSFNNALVVPILISQRVSRAEAATGAAKENC